MADFAILANDAAANSADRTRLSQPKQLEDAAADFEAIFARQMIAAMRSASLGDGLLDSNASGTFRDQFDGAVADIMGRRGALGFGEALMRSLDRGQGSNPDQAAASVGRSLQSYRDAAR